MKVLNSKILLLGFTFKEDCPDVRNTRVIDIYNELRNFDINVDVFDPWANPQEVKSEYGIEISNSFPNEFYAAVILAVAHKQFLDLDIRSLTPNGVVFDVKGVLSRDIVDLRL